LFVNFYVRWISEEYSFFYLENSASAYVFRAASSGIGDAGDSVNNADSPLPGSAFATASSFCVDRAGPWWYLHPTYFCSYLRFLGITAEWNKIPLQIVRMMVKQNY
jgi:hypothetical protein